MHNYGMFDKAQIEELTRRIDEVLYYLWDPIGVSDEPCARGEYSTYVDSIYNLVIQEEDTKLITMLSEIESAYMGLNKNMEKNKLIAKRLINEKHAVENGLR